MTAAPLHDVLRLTNGIVELHVATAFGPRVTHYGFCGGPNVFGDAPSAMRDTPRGTWRAYGGHRLWIAPERFPETYTVDDQPPAIEHDEHHAIVHRARDPVTGFVISLQLTLQRGSSEILVRHVITNDGTESRTVAPWGITVVRSGGTALIPNPVRREQRDALLPARSMALWSYTDLSDPRFGFGPSFVRLRCDAAIAAPTKIGVACERGWIAYVVENAAFVTSSTFDATAVYPDRNCSVEVFTAADYCEVETLGPLTTLAPGASAHHDVRWSLLAGVNGDDDPSLAAALEPHVYG